MKKVTEMIKPMLLLIFGALFLLTSLNGLQGQGADLALSIFAVIFASYYLAIGILDVVIGNKFNKTLKMVFDILNVSLFATLMLIQFIVEIAQNVDNMGPTAWIISIVSIVASLALVVTFIISKFARQQIISRLVYMFAAIFVLVLILDIVFDATGAEMILGLLPIITPALYGLYTAILLGTISKQEEAPKAEPEQVIQQPEENPQE